MTRAEPAASAPAAVSTYVALVRLYGLVGKPEYNGRRGTVLMYTKPRCEVLLDAESCTQRSRVLVLEQNLELLQTPPVRDKR
jgi:hypothetical protein